jgi:hypothetical protein
MNVMKSLVLGSAAALLAGAGAQAADLPIKAKAVEYVRVCSLYGAGFYYIPGTDTCIKLGGYVRADVMVRSNGDFNASYSGVPAAQNRLTNNFQWRSREDFNVDTRTATEYGVVRTYADVVFTWTSGTYSGTGNGSTFYSTGSATSAATGLTSVNGLSNDGIAGGSLGVYSAFIQFAGFTLGRATSAFDAPWTNYPGNNFDQLVGGSGTVTGINQITYTADFGQGITATISAQDPALNEQSNLYNASLSSAGGILGGNYGSSDFGGLVAPDIVGAVRVDQAWGLFQASAVAHDNHAAYYGATETSGHPGDKWGWAGQLALSIKNIPTGPGDTFNIQGVYTDGATRYNINSLGQTTYSMFGSSSAPGAYGSIGLASASDGVFGTNTGIELTKSYGLRGAFTHNWDPYWNTAVYGAWAAFRYDGAAKNIICSSPGGLALAAASTGFSCNPDFNITQVGVITRWTPVKNLTFSVDVIYSHLDQKYTGLVNAAAFSSVAKPAAIYELKDQDTVSMLWRAQRNF